MMEYQRTKAVRVLRPHGPLWVKQASSQKAPRSGTLLMREHAGVLHRLMVADVGFAWNGRIYDSLSQVAFAITGTRWNGPRFFGLRNKDKGRDAIKAKAGQSLSSGSGNQSRASVDALGSTAVGGAP